MAQASSELLSKPLLDKLSEIFKQVAETFNVAQIIETNEQHEFSVTVPADTATQQLSRLAGGVYSSQLLDGYFKSCEGLKQLQQVFHENGYTLSEVMFTSNNMNTTRVSFCLSKAPVASP